MIVVDVPRRKRRTEVEIVGLTPEQREVLKAAHLSPQVESANVRIASKILSERGDPQTVAIGKKVDYYINDEEKAYREYMDLAAELERAGLKDAARTLEGMARDEHRHHALLQGIRRGL